MSDLVIRSGGAVDVDTASLRAASGRFGLLADLIGERARDAAVLVSILAADPGPAVAVALDMSMLQRALERGAERARRLQASLDGAADLYEAVELIAERRLAEAAGDAAAVARIERSLTLATADDPSLRDTAQALLDIRGDGLGVVAQASAGALLLAPGLGLALPTMLLSLLTTTGVRMAGRGPVAAHARLGGRALPVAIAATPPVPVSAPASLAEASSRIPGGGQTRVRVERYGMGSGAAQYAVYVAGTQSVEPDEAFDMRANLALYGGDDAASYRAALDALAAAGARPGDVVHAFGHSQGAMIAERLALEGPYDTRTLVSFGSPIQSDVGDQTLAVSVRHTDDPVAALAAGGHPVPVGSPGSFVVERLADPMPGLHDLGLPAHHMTAYAETAALLDASDDPRVDGLRRMLADLGGAGDGEATDFSVARVSPVAEDAAACRRSR